MKPARFIYALFLFTLVASTAGAQAPDWQIFGGGSFLRASAGSGNFIIQVPGGGTITESLQQNAYGWIISGTENVNSWFGGTAEVSGYYANRTVLGVRVNGSAYPFLFGPEFSYRASRFAVFGHPMIGGADARASIASTNANASETKWAYALGGGVDYSLGSRLSVRVEGDWLRTHFPDTLAKDFQNNFRVSGGLVLKIGTTQKGIR